MAIKDRIKELRRVKASELRANPKNWRTHPIAQKDALEGILSTVGYADALIARETSDGLELIDGHLRAKTTPDEEVPVLVLDITEKEADLLLATLDPLGTLAGRDELKLKELLEGIENDSAGLSELLESLRGVTPEIPDLDNWQDEWQGMPEFIQDDLSPYRSISVHFRNEADIADFTEKLGQSVTDRTKSMWHPELERNNYQDDRYTDAGADNA
jgi:hypothetical protein